MVNVARSFCKTLSFKLEKPVRYHLKTMFVCLTVSSIAAAVGAYLYIYMELMTTGLYEGIAAFAFSVFLVVTPNAVKNLPIRVIILLGYAFFSGLATGPLLATAKAITTRSLTTSYMGTSIISISFTIAALKAECGFWLYLGGTIMSLLTTELLLFIANLLGFKLFLFNLYFYVGLYLMCEWVSLKTHRAIEACHFGDNDFVGQSLSVHLVFNVISIAQLLLIVFVTKIEPGKELILGNTTLQDYSALQKAYIDL